MIKFKNLFFLSIMILSITLAGCAEKKEDISLDLPDTEIKQLESMEKTSDIEEVVSKESNMPQTGKKRFYVYADQGYFKNNFTPSGWMGDYGDINFFDGFKEKPYSRQSSIRIIYSADKKQNTGWAGIYWQEPANNWGNVPGGFDLTGATKLVFYARGEKGGELITEFKMGGIQSEYSDSTSSSIGPIVLTPEWEKYEIDLQDKDLSNVIGGFAFVISEMENPDGATFYLDEIKYE